MIAEVKTFEIQAKKVIEVQVDYYEKCTKILFTIFI